MILPLHPAPLKRASGISVITLGPTPLSSTELNTLLERGLLRDVRTSCDVDEFTEMLWDQDVDVVVCELRGVPCDGMLLPARLRREFGAGRLDRLPKVLWVSDLPRSILDACARPFRLIGGALEIVSSASGVTPSFGRFAQVDVADTPRFKDEDLILALGAEGGIRVVLQPQVDLDSGKILGAEALVRWRHPTFGEVPASELVKAVSRLSLGPRLFHVVTEHVLNLQTALAIEGVSLRISVNATVSTLSVPGVARSLEERTVRRGISPSQITIEIIEVETLKDKTELEAGLQRLRAIGFGVSMDDFGTGTSTLERLSLLPFSEIKIDQTFVRRIESEPASQAVVAAAIGIGRALGLGVIAEGIETPEQVDLLQSMGCRIGQGFGLACPMEIDVFFAEVL